MARADRAVIVVGVARAFQPFSLAGVELSLLGNMTESSFVY
jgi:hypothetical protein